MFILSKNCDKEHCAFNALSLVITVWVSQLKKGNHLINTHEKSREKLTKDFKKL